MKVLVATAMYPTTARPYFGTFVKTRVESLRRAGVDVETFVLDGPSRKLMYATAVPKLRQRVARGDIDLVHAHYSYVGAVARLQRRVPIVLTFHGDDLLGTRDARGRTALWSRGVAAGGRTLARTVDAVIVQTQQMAERLRGIGQVYVIPHEVDFDLFHPVPTKEARAALGLPPGRRYLLFAASPLVATKNFPLAKAVEDHLRRTDPSVELLVVDREPQDRLMLYMNACDALVFTSFAEGSPNVVKQAMACNLPVIATDVGDVRQLIARTDGCRVVERDVEAVAEAVRRVLERGMRTDGRDQIGHLDRDVITPQVIDVYSRVLAQPRPPVAQAC